MNGSIGLVYGGVGIVNRDAAGLVYRDISGLVYGDMA